MDFSSIEIWLKTTILGIVVLGALGSTVAVVFWKLAGAFISKIVPWPFKIHRKKSTKQAYMLGYAAAVINSDETGRRLSAYLVYHLSLLVISLVVFLASLIIFSVIVAITPDVALTFGLFVLVTLSFLSVYWAYFEFKYINRTFLFFWKEALKRAEDSHAKPKESHDPNEETKT